MLQIIERVRGTATVFMSTHILNDVERVCDRVAILNYGRLVAESPIEELLERYAQPVFELEADAHQSRGTDRLADALRRQPWTREVRLEGETLRVFVHDPKAAAAEILPIALGTGVSLARFERARPSLEDVFMLLVAKQDRVPSSASLRPAPNLRRLIERTPLMPGFRILLAKELREQLRTYRLPVVAVVFLTFGILSPVTARYMPEIAKAFGGTEAAAIVAALGTPTASDAVERLLGYFVQFGLLISILLAMGSVATEKERGTAALMLSKPVSRGAFLAAKLAAIAINLAVAVAVGASVGYLYIGMLFGTWLPGAGFAAMAALLWLTLVAFAAFTFLGSTLTRSALAAAGIGFVAFAISATLGNLPVVGAYMPGSLAAPAQALALGADPGFVAGPIAATVATVMGLAMASQLAFRTQEL